MPKNDTSKKVPQNLEEEIIELGRLRNYVSDIELYGDNARYVERWEMLAKAIRGRGFVDMREVEAARKEIDEERERARIEGWERTKAVLGRRDGEEKGSV